MHVISLAEACQFLATTRDGTVRTPTSKKQTADKTMSEALQTSGCVPVPGQSKYGRVVSQQPGLWQ